MDYLFVDPSLRMDPDYIRVWWQRFEAEERLLGEMGLPFPEPPWNAPGWEIDASDPRAATSVAADMDASQALVVAHTTGPALVMAGAGSGKTRTITARVVRLLERGVQPSQILCLTFTRKAAREMRERIAKKVGESAKNITISTFHALALDLLRKYPASCDRTETFSVWDDGVQKNEVKALIKSHPRAEGIPRGEWISAKEVCAALDDLKERGETISSKAFFLAFGKIDEQAWEIALAYEELKESCNTLDFADLVWSLTLRLLGEHSAKRADIQSRWEYVIVDEYQDTNTIQEMLLQRLVERHQNLMVVGDEDQAIYSFRGSDVGFIRTFPERYPNVRTYLLGRNYRSTPQIVESANALISQNKQRNFKTVWSEGEAGTAVVVGQWGSPQSEARAIAHEIDRARGGGHPDSNLAVLVRMRRQFIPIQMELQRLRIPFHVVGDIPWYARMDAKIVLAWLRGLINPLDLDAGAGVLLSWDGLGSGMVNHWKEAMSSVGEPMFSRLDYLHGRQGLGIHTKRGQKLAEFGKAWRAWEQTTHGNGASLRARVHGLLDTLGIVQEINEGKLSPKPNDVTEATNREGFFMQLLESMPDAEGTGGWTGIQTWLDDLFTAGTQHHAQEGVCLSTIHGSKGLEWECVWLPGWSDGVFPSEWAGPGEIEEERRLAYVAVTRARAILSVSWFTHSSIPDPMDHGPSPFLAELDPTRTRDAAWTKVKQWNPDAVPAPPTKPVHDAAKPGSLSVTLAEYPSDDNPHAQNPIRIQSTSVFSADWFTDAFGELENPVVDADQSENGWFGWSELGTVTLDTVEVHGAENPVRCIACNRTIRISVAMVTEGRALPARFRMGRRCAARMLNQWGKIFDATRAATALKVAIKTPTETSKISVSPHQVPLIHPT